MSLLMFCRSKLIKRISVAMLMTVSSWCLSAAAASGTGAADANEQWSESFLQIDLNQQGLNQTVLLLRGVDGDVLLAGEDLLRWRVRLPASPALQRHQQDFYRLRAIAGASFQIDEGKQLVSITLPPSAFDNLNIEHAIFAAPSPSIANAGLLFNYDMLAEHSTGHSLVSVFGELAGFSALGNASTSFIANTARKQVIRLDSGWSLDQPDRLASWRVGDAISRAASAWGNAVRFGGIQYASNFSVQPGLITMPQKTISGQAALPSTVDVFVNNALVQRSEVPPGPFSFNNIPTVTGQGTVRVVVRDVLGREQVITQAFFASPRLLRSGLNDFSYEIGRQRNNYTVLSNDYGRTLAAATLRHGWTDDFTGEMHLETMSGKQATMGFNGVWGIPALALTVNSSLAASTAAQQTGYLSSLGAEMQYGQLNLAGRTQGASQHFTQTGLEPDQLAPRRLTNLTLGYSAGLFGSVGAAYVKQDLRGTPSSALLALTYSLSIGKAAFLGVTLLHSLIKPSNDSLGVFLMLPFDSATTATANAQQVKGASGPASMNLNLQHAMAPDERFGYQLQASRDGRKQAEVSTENAVGSYALDVVSQAGAVSTRASVAGGVVALGGSVFASRRVSDSFALVQVPGYPNVRVYTDNQLVGRTDANGNALLSHVRAYEKNPITIESLDLPLDAKIDALQLDAVPFYRSGVVVKFPVVRSRGGSFKVMLESGAALPVGAQIHFDQQTELFPVATDGEVYLSGLAQRNVLHIDWHGQHCQIIVPYPESQDPVPFLGSFVCAGVNP